MPASVSGPMRSRSRVASRSRSTGMSREEPADLALADGVPAAGGAPRRKRRSRDQCGVDGCERLGEASDGGAGEHLPSAAQVGDPGRSPTQSASASATGTSAGVPIRCQRGRAVEQVGGGPPSRPTPGSGRGARRRWCRPPACRFPVKNRRAPTTDLTSCRAWRASVVSPSSARLLRRRRRQAGCAWRAMVSQALAVGGPQGQDSPSDRTVAADSARCRPQCGRPPRSPPRSPARGARGWIAPGPPSRRPAPRSCASCWRSCRSIAPIHRSVCWKTNAAHRRNRATSSSVGPRR